MLRLVIRLVIALTLIATVVHEGGQILFAQTKADDIAQEAARVGADTFAGTKNAAQARADAAACPKASPSTFKYRKNTKLSAVLTVTAPMLIRAGVRVSCIE